MESLDIEIYRMSVMLLAGVAAGLLLDLYRVFRWVTAPRGFVVYVEDAIFWVVMTPILVFALLVSNWVALRFYAFLGFAVGFVIYLVFGSPAVVLSLTWVAVCLGRLWRAVRRAVRRAFSWFRSVARRISRRLTALRRVAGRLRRRVAGRARAAAAWFRNIARRARHPKDK